MTVYRPHRNPLAVIVAALASWTDALRRMHGPELPPRRRQRQSMPNPAAQAKRAGRSFREPRRH